MTPDDRGTTTSVVTWRGVPAVIATADEARYAISELVRATTQSDS